jgi:hypothetical protein
VGERRRAGWHVLTALPHMAAVLLQGALRTEGIAAELDRDGLAAVYGLDGGGLATRVVVPADDAERALHVLSVLES